MTLNKIKSWLKTPPKFGRTLALIAGLSLAVGNKPVTHAGKQIRDTMGEIKDSIHAAVDPEFAIDQTIEKLGKVRPKNPEKKLQLQRKITDAYESGRKMTLEEYIFEAEEADYGMTTSETREAKEFIGQLVSNLNETKPDIPNKKFLEDVLKIIIDPQKPEQGYAKSLASVTRLILRMKANHQRMGNCDPRAMFLGLILEKLYPERSNDITFEDFNNDSNQQEAHIRTLFHIPEENKIYALEPGIPEISSDELAQTANYGIKALIAAYTGNSEFNQPVKISQPINITDTSHTHGHSEHQLPKPQIVGVSKPYREHAPNIDLDYGKIWAHLKEERALLEKDLEEEKAAVEKTKKSSPSMEMETLPVVTEAEINETLEQF